MFLLLIQSLLTVGRLTKCWIAAFPIRRELTPCLLYHLFTSYQCTGEELQWEWENFQGSQLCLTAWMPATWTQRIGKPLISGAKTTACRFSFSASTAFLARVLLPAAAVEGNWSFLARQQWDNFPTCLLTVLWQESASGREKKPHNPANCGIRIKAGEKSCFAVTVLAISPIKTKLLSAWHIAVVAMLES